MYYKIKNLKNKIYSTLTLLREIASILFIFSVYSDRKQIKEVYTDTTCLKFSKSEALSALRNQSTVRFFSL